MRARRLGAARAGYSRRSRPGTRRGTGRTAWPGPGAGCGGCGRGWARTAAEGGGRESGQAAGGRRARADSRRGGTPSRKTLSASPGAPPRRAGPSGGKRERCRRAGARAGAQLPLQARRPRPRPRCQGARRSTPTPARHAARRPASRSRAPRLPSLRAGEGNFASSPALASFPSSATLDLEDGTLQGEGSTPPSTPAFDGHGEPGLQAAEVLWRCCQDEGCARVGDLPTVRERVGRAVGYLGSSAYPAWLLPSAPGFVF